MMHPPSPRVLSCVSSCVTVFAFVVGCGSTPEESQFPQPEDSPGNDIAANQFIATNEARPACVTSSAGGEPLPARLVFMYDRSESMQNNNKWASCRGATERFFASAQGMSASLSFFPGSGDQCTSAYNVPAVSMRALPDTNAFATAIRGTAPAGNTPTLPALQGAYAYARTQQDGKHKVAVVLVTDGEPNVCGSTLDAVSNAARTAAKDVPTFVIGVGKSLSNLNRIAAAGGTQQAILVEGSDATQTGQQLEAALRQVQNALSCDLAIPVAPAGQELNFGTVNVVYTPAGGGPDTLTYNQTCSGGTGWHYDNPQTPTRIQVCETSCKTMRAAAGKVDVQFGCATKGGVPR